MNTNRINKKDLDPAIFDLYNDFAHNRIDRRGFMDGLSVYAVGGLTVPALVEYLMPRYQTRQQTSPEDPDLNTEFIYYDSEKGGGRMKAQLSR